MTQWLPLDKMVVERLNGGEPILRAIPSHDWENEVVFNPACVLVEGRERISRLARALKVSEPVSEELESLGAVAVLIYRAQGKPTPAEDFRHSRFGLALLTPQLSLMYRHPVPVMIPEHEYEDLGVEDPRITLIDGRYVMLYAGYSSHGSRVPSGDGSNKIGVCLAFSDDLVNWEKQGPLNGKLNDVDNKNAALFPTKMDGDFHMLHRPMEGPGSMTVHVAHSSSISGDWSDDGMLMAAMDYPQFSRSWIGAGAPPLSIGGNEYLALYHTGHYKPDGSREYDIGLSKLRFDKKVSVVDRIEFFMRPLAEVETVGNKSLGVNNVLFVCGAYLYDGYLYFPYAGADTLILAARVKCTDN